jgi:hypothetical protein
MHRQNKDNDDDDDYVLYTMKEVSVIFCVFPI